MPASLTPDRALVAGRGVVLLSAVAAAPPTLAQIETYVASNLAGASLPAGHSIFGVTSPDDLPKPNIDGGGTKMLHTWEFPNAREIEKEPQSISYVVTALQLDNATMALYEGGGDTSAANIFAAPGAPVATAAGATIVYINKGGSVVGYHSPKVMIRSGGDMKHAKDDWSQIPLRFGEVNLPGKAPHVWIGPHFGNAA